MITETTITIEQEKNWTIAQRINRETRANAASPYAGKFVGVWHEQVVSVGDTLDEVCDAMEVMGEPAASECCVIEASADNQMSIYLSPWLRGTLTFT